MLNNAPYIGGFSPGAQLFAVDGDFTNCQPEGIPEISYPFKGDSILSQNDIVIFHPDVPAFANVRLGIWTNFHPWNANQQSAVLEQDFVVAQSAYIPMRLNTPYDPAWAIAWKGKFGDGASTVDLGQFFLVEEGELKDIGGGICKLHRKFATLPYTRCEIEQFAYTFIGIDQGQIQRPQYTQNVQSRIQYDYFIFDDYGVLAANGIDFDNFNNGGPLLDASTGLYPNGLILPVMQYFANSNISTSYGIYVGTPIDILTDGDPTDPTTATLPSATDYLGYCTGLNTSNGQAAELVAESSTMTRWMGNIFERRTRFVLAQ